MGLMQLTQHMVSQVNYLSLLPQHMTSIWAELCINKGMWYSLSETQVWREEKKSLQCVSTDKPDRVEWKEHRATRCLSYSSTMSKHQLTMSHFLVDS